MTSFCLVFADNFEFVLAKVIAVACKFDVILIFASFFAILADDWIFFDAQALAEVRFDFPFFLSSDAIFRNIVGEAKNKIFRPGSVHIHKSERQDDSNGQRNATQLPGFEHAKQDDDHDRNAEEAAQEILREI